MKVKEMLMVMVFVGIFLTLLFIGVDRVEKIENGEMTLVSQREK